MPRYIFLTGAALALVVFALAFTDWALSRCQGVAEADAGRVRQGMNVAEVEALLGGPPASRDGNVLQWDGRDGAVFVFLDPDERVVGAEFERWGLGDGHATPQSSGLLSRLRAWLGW